MMRKNPYKKILIIGIIIIFIGTSILPGINGKINYNEVFEKNNQNTSTVTLYAIEETSLKENKVDISTEDAEIIFNMFNELKDEITLDPYSEKTQQLRNNFVSMLDENGMLPTGVSKEHFNSLLSPPSSNQPKNHFFNRILQILENKLNNLNPPVESYGASATLNFCTIGSYGNGYTIPVMIPPRPRLGIIWNSYYSITYAGAVFSNKAIYAEGAQIGSTIGFTGGGGTFAFPEGKFYVVVGYTWHVSISADHIDFYPPNQKPVISNENPTNGAVDVPLSLSELSFRISDQEGEKMDYTVTTEPDIGSGSGNNKGDGVYNVPVSGLEYDKMYTWTVEVSDGNYLITKKFIFYTPLRPPFDPFDEGWQYHKKITIDHNKVAGDLNNFPILISIVDSDLKNKAQSDGDDILFMDGIGVASKIYYEIEKYDSSTGEFIGWARIPSLSSNIDTDLYMYYGNPSCSSQQFPARAWDSNYAAVLHMSDATTSTVDDSTSNLNIGYKYTANDPQESQEGKIHKCQQHNSNNNYLRINDDSSLDIRTGDTTMEIWLKTTSNLWEQFFYSDDGSDYNKISFLKLDDDYGCVGQIFVRGNSAYSFVRGITSLNDGEWHYIVGTIDNSQAGKSDDIRLFIDGKEETLSEEDHNWDGSTLTNSIDKWIGTRRNVNKPFQGFLDEFRLSLYKRSDEWIETSYNTMNDPLSFIIVGPEET